MINLYTEKFFFVPRIKSAIKVLTGRQNRGPKSVEESLELGLIELGENYTINQKVSESIASAGILSGVKTLAWAIKQKKSGKIKKIVAGPNLVVDPEDSNGILKDPLIDIIIVPSLWVKEYYCQVDSSLEKRIQIWPAGVELQPSDHTSIKKSVDFLIYNKIGNRDLFKNICNILYQQNFSYNVLNYGQFKQPEYFELLEKTKYEIYLSKSESQGLAMFEAWARGVPTLIWESGQYTSPEGIKVQGKISAPYLVSEVGTAFASAVDFKEKLEQFLKTYFEPRKYVEENFSNKMCAQKYLSSCAS